jgi:phosphinothricin acetyltransferase
MPYHYIAVREKHLQSLAEILNYYVINTTVTFHTQVLSAEDMYAKVFFSDPIYGTFLIMEEKEIVGYCTLMQWKKQQAYRHTAEVSIYLKPDFTAKGIGSHALNYLEKIAEQNDIRTLIAGCCAENTSSIKLFEKNKFVQCAYFKQVGFKFGRYLDTLYLQKVL